MALRCWIGVPGAGSATGCVGGAVGGRFDTGLCGWCDRLGALSALPLLLLGMAACYVVLLCGFCFGEPAVRWPCGECVLGVPCAFPAVGSGEAMRVFLSGRALSRCSVCGVAACPRP